jgi:hypothetical protein
LTASLLAAFVIVVNMAIYMASIIEIVPVENLEEQRPVALRVPADVWAVFKLKVLP